MVRAPGLFWMVWRSLDGREHSTLHPQAVAAVQDGVDQFLHRQYATKASDELLLPAYSYDDEPKPRHACVSPPAPDDRLLCRTIWTRPQPKTEAEQACNELTERIIAQLEPYNFGTSVENSYGTSPAEHAMLQEAWGHVDAVCRFQPRRFTRKLMRQVRNSVDPKAQIG